MEGTQETLAENDLETGQSKIRDVLAPMCMLWTIIEKAATQENSEKKDQVPLKDIIRLIEESIIPKCKTNDFHPLRVFCPRENLLPLFFSVCLFLFCLLVFACDARKHVFL